MPRGQLAIDCALCAVNTKKRATKISIPELEYRYTTTQRVTPPGNILTKVTLTCDAVFKSSFLFCCYGYPNIGQWGSREGGHLFIKCFFFKKGPSFSVFFSPARPSSSRRRWEEDYRGQVFVLYFLCVWPTAMKVTYGPPDWLEFNQVRDSGKRDTIIQSFDLGGIDCVRDYQFKVQPSLNQILVRRQADEQQGTIRRARTTITTTTTTSNGGSWKICKFVNKFMGTRHLKNQLNLDLNSFPKIVIFLWARGLAQTAIGLTE